MIRHLKLWLPVSVCLALMLGGAAQATHDKELGAATRKDSRHKPAPEPTPPDADQDIETLKIDTNLVTVPIIATDRNGLYVSDLTQGELSIAEEGVKQNIAFFASVSAPFHVVLMLDTSASTRDTLTPIQRAAIAFVQQLQTADRVKVISFDDDVRDHNDFTNDRKQLEAAILKTESGRGTKLYDAFELALASLKSIRGRKAIVLFSDGVDFRSDYSNFDGTLRGLDEEGVIVYPIRYDTRKETERIAREQSQDQGITLPTISVIRRPPPGTTAPTFPSDDRDSVPTSGSPRQTGPLGLPLPGEILRRRRGTDPDRDRLPPDDRRPIPSSRDDGMPERRDDSTFPTGRSSRRDEDSIDAMLDQLYSIADSYLNQLASKSGGRLMRADTLGVLPEAFGKIAAELRTQYLLGYYPTDQPQVGQYRRIKVTTSRKSVVIRARPGYRTVAKR